MAEFVRDECESCHAPVIWTVTANAKRMPVDFEPSSTGDVALRPGSPAPIATVLSVTKQFGRTDLRTSHFSSCPDAKSWRKRGRS